MSYIYLATPYSVGTDGASEHSDNVREARYLKAVQWTAEMSLKGEVVFSPIVHSHPLAVYHDLPGTWDFWSKIDYAFIDSCSKVRVMMYDMWEQSVGMKAEIEYAKKIGKPVEYVDPRNAD